MEVIEKEKIKRAQELANGVKTTKEAIRQAIARKDVDIPEDTLFADYPEKIDGIYPDALFLRQSGMGQLPTVTLPEGQQTTDIADVLIHGNRLFVLGDQGDIYEGNDRKGWQFISELQSNSWNSIAYGNGVFVAVQSYYNTTNGYFYSTDLVSWTQGTLPYQLKDMNVFFDGTRFLLTGSTGSYDPYILSSSDGISWTTICTKDNLPSDVYYVAGGLNYINGLYFFSYRTRANYLRLYYSSDLSTFTNTKLNEYSLSAQYEVQYIDGTYFALACSWQEDAQLHYASNPSSWSTIGTSLEIKKLLYAKGKFYGYSQAGEIYRSDTGKKGWTKISDSAFTYGEDFLFWNNKFILIKPKRYGSTDNIFQYSYDGVEWSSVAGNSIFDADFVDKRAETEAWLETVPEAVVNALYTKTAPLNAAYREGVNAYIGE